MSLAKSALRPENQSSPNLLTGSMGLTDEQDCSWRWSGAGKSISHLRPQKVRARAMIEHLFPQSCSKLLVAVPTQPQRAKFLPSRWDKAAQGLGQSQAGLVNVNV